MAPLLSHLPSAPSLLSITAALLALYFAYTRTLAWYRLRHIPGPPLASFSYLYMLSATIGGQQSESYRALTDKYGPLVRIGPYDLLTADPEVVRRMNGARSGYRRSTWYFASRMDPYLPSLFNIMDTGAHDRLKAQLSSGYGGKENPGVEEGIDEQLAALVGLLRRRYVAKGEGEMRPADFAMKAQFFTLDAITKIAYGRAFGYLATDSDVHGYIAAAEAQVRTIGALGDVPWLARLVFSEAALKVIGPKPTDKSGMGKMMA